LKTQEFSSISMVLSAPSMYHSTVSLTSANKLIKVISLAQSVDSAHSLILYWSTRWLSTEWRMPDPLCWFTNASAVG